MSDGCVVVVDVVEGVTRGGAVPTGIPSLPDALNLALNLERRRLSQRLVVPHVARVVAVEDAAKRWYRNAGGPKGESRVRLGVEEFRDAHVGDVVVVVV